MCYFARTNFKCGDWRWGNMKLQCPREHRRGEQCGLRFLHDENLLELDEDCKICQEIAVKKRKLQRENANIERWTREGSKLMASIHKARIEVEILQSKIANLEDQRPSVIAKNNWSRRGGAMATRTPGGEPSSANSYMGSPSSSSNRSLSGYVRDQSRSSYSPSNSTAGTERSWPSRSG